MNLTLDFLAKLLPQFERRDVGLGQLHWYDEAGCECSVTEFTPDQLVDAKRLAAGANDISFCGNFRFSRTTLC